MLYSHSAQLSQSQRLYSTYYLLTSSIVQITQDQNVTEGHNVTLMCNVSGIPLPMVSWMTPDSQHVSGYKLEVTNINRTQAGEYKCEASNECGNATETARSHIFLSQYI